MFTTNVKRSAAALAATAGLLAAAAPASHADSWGISQVGTVKAPVSSDSYSWGQGWPTYRSGLKTDSNEVAKGHHHVADLPLRAQGRQQRGRGRGPQGRCQRGPVRDVHPRRRRGQGRRHDHGNPRARLDRHHARLRGLPVIALDPGSSGICPTSTSGPPRSRPDQLGTVDYSNGSLLGGTVVTCARGFVFSCSEW